MNRRGFISTSVIYTILIVCLLMLMMLLLIYYNNRMALTELKDDLRYYLYTEYSYNDADVLVYVWQENSSIENDYILVEVIPDENSYYLSKMSCINSSSNEVLDSNDYSFDEGVLKISIDNIFKGQIECNLYYEYKGAS